MPFSPSTPRRQFRRNQPETPASQKKRLNGYVRGPEEWYCNCEPRQPAAHRQVRDTKKPSYGNWFYTCSSRPPCGFFLWQDAAEARERGLEGGQTEKDEHEEAQLRRAWEKQAKPLPTQTQTRGAQPGASRMPTMTQTALTRFGIQVTPGRQTTAQTLDGDETASGTDSEGPVETPSRGPKRKRPAIEIEDDDDILGNMASDEEREMAAMADAASSASKPKTPTTQIDSATGLATPGTARTLFPDAKRQKTVSFEEAPKTPGQKSSSSTSTLTPTTLATPSTGTLSTPSSNTPSEELPDPTQQILSLLSPHNIPSSTLSSIRSVLETSSRRAKGVAMGRDAARNAVREKDAKIARLQERVAMLENKERMMNAQVTNMKAGMMKMWQDN